MDIAYLRKIDRIILVHKTRPIFMLFINFGHSESSGHAGWDVHFSKTCLMYTQ